MINAPWLTPEKLRLVDCLLISYRNAFGHSLLAVEKSQLSLPMASRELFELRSPVVAHEGGIDPLISYANSSALKLWVRQWDQMVGMPSKLTAPKEELATRAFALDNALERGALVGYSGIRMDSLGRRFLIHNAAIWTIWNHNGVACGQATSFSNWSFI